VNKSLSVLFVVVLSIPALMFLLKKENEDSSIGYIHIKEFNAVAKKDFDSCVLLVCEPYYILIGVQVTVATHGIQMRFQNELGLQEF
jgi:hypothetical protein